jgi:hypothetical protein
MKATHREEETIRAYVEGQGYESVGSPGEGGLRTRRAGASRYMGRTLSRKSLVGRHEPHESLHHLAGALGAALLDSFRARDWLIPRSTPRALRLTTTGRQALASHFDVDVSGLTNVWAVTAQAPSL